MIYDDAEVYGPYIKTGSNRKMIVLSFESGKRTSMNYARYLMERYLNRKLDKNEHVDHINGDNSDDRIENLQLMFPLTNVQKHHGVEGDPEVYHFLCRGCSKMAVMPFWRYREHLKKNTKPKFCSRACANRR